MSEFDSVFPQPIPCNECHAGMMHARQLTYFTWLGDELITVPHFPAWICDLCGKREYDEKAILWLNMLLDPNAGKPTKNRRRTPPPPRPRAGSPHPTPDSN
jgi:YgiT-type zinc finger domain-containing protein